MKKNCSPVARGFFALLCASIVTVNSSVVAIPANAEEINTDILVNANILDTSISGDEAIAESNSDDVDDTSKTENSNNEDSAYGAQNSTAAEAENEEAVEEISGDSEKKIEDTLNDTTNNQNTASDRDEITNKPDAASDSDETTNEPDAASDSEEATNESDAASDVNGSSNEPDSDSDDEAPVALKDSETDQSIYDEIPEEIRNSKYFNHEVSPWLANFEYSIEGDTVILNKNTSFEFGDGFMIIPSGALVDGRSYSVVVNLTSDFFCEEVRNNAVYVQIGGSYLEGLEKCESLSNNYYNIDSESGSGIGSEIFKAYSKVTGIDREALSYSDWDRCNGEYVNCNGSANMIFAGFHSGFYNLRHATFYDVDSCEYMYTNSNIFEVDSDTIPDGIHDAALMFSDCKNLKRVRIDISPSFIAAKMFSDCTNLIEVNITGPDNSSYVVGSDRPIVNVSNMFWGCNNLKEVRINNLNITCIQEMFSGCTNLCEVDFSGSKWLTEGDYEPVDDSSTTDYDLFYTKEGVDNYKLFKDVSCLYGFTTFNDIVTYSDEENPYIFLGGGIFETEGDDGSYYRGIDKSTPNNTQLIRRTTDTHDIIFYDRESNQEMVISYLDTIDILPTTSQYGKDFSGWFTKRTYGKKADISDIALAYDELYAVFQYPYEIKYYDEMANFYNGDFSTGKYYVSDSTWERVKYNLTKTELKNLKKDYKGMNFTKYEGICFGISVASIAAHMGKLPYNKKICDLRVSDVNDRELLTLYQLGQTTNDFLGERAKFAKYDNERKMIELVNRALRINTEGPAIFSYYIPDTQYDEGGEHAVVIDGCEVLNNTVINGQKYKWKISTYNIVSNEGVEDLKTGNAVNVALPTVYDIYVSEDYKYMTNTSQLEYGGVPQDGSRIIAVYDNIDFMNYFGTLKASEKKNGYGLISIAKGKISKLQESLSKIGSIAGTENEDTSEKYIIDHSEGAAEPIEIEAAADGIEFTYETQNKLITYKSDSTEPVKISYIKETDDYKIDAVGGNYIEIEVVNDDGASYGTVLAGTMSESGKGLEISSENGLVKINSDSQIKADLFVDEQAEKVASISSKGVSIADQESTNKVEVRLDINNNGNYDDRTVDINYSGDVVVSIDDSNPAIDEDNKPGSDDDNKPGSGDDNNQGNTDNTSSNTDNSNASGEQSHQSRETKSVDTDNNEQLAVGTSFSSDGKVYQVTGDCKVKIVGVEDKRIKSLSIPSSVSYEGRNYSVTEVGKNAFKALKKLNKVTIPSSVRSIGKKAFYNCANLKNVTIKANTSLSVGKSAFKKVNKDCTIKIKGLKKKAKTAMKAKIQKQTNGTVK